MLFLLPDGGFGETRRGRVSDLCYVRTQQRARTALMSFMWLTIPKLQHLAFSFSLAFSTDICYNYQKAIREEHSPPMNKFTYDHDFHIHSRLSSCSHDPEQSPEQILRYAEKENLKIIKLEEERSALLLREAELDRKIATECAI